MRIVVADDVVLTREGISAPCSKGSSRCRRSGGRGPGPAPSRTYQQPRGHDRRHPLVGGTRVSSPRGRIRSDHFRDQRLPALAVHRTQLRDYGLLEEHPERVGYLLKRRVFDVRRPGRRAAPHRRGRERGSTRRSSRAFRPRRRRRIPRRAEQSVQEVLGPLPRASRTSAITSHLFVTRAPSSRT